MGPVAVALAGTQFMIIVTTGGRVGRRRAGSAALNYGFRLIHLPIGLVGVALGTVSLAAASRRAAAGDAAGARRRDPPRASAQPLPGASRGRRARGARRADRAPGLRAGRVRPRAHGARGRAVRGYALGIVFYAGIKVAAAAFHARGDMRRPMTASLVGIGVEPRRWPSSGRAWLGFAALPLATASARS